jgi:isochorismate hydrolase
VPIDPAPAALLISDVPMTLASDACAALSAERHEQSLAGMKGCCRQRRTTEILAEIAAPDPG